MAIVLFTLITKVILLPISIWVQKNSIKMVRMLPELNNIKADCFGDADRIADETSKIFKRDKYNPLANIIPLIIQIALLMGVIEVIYHPLNYLLHINSDIIQQLTAIIAQATGANPQDATIQLAVVSAVQSGAFSSAFSIIPAEVLLAIQGLNLNFFTFHLSQIPSQVGGVTFISPAIAGFSAWLLCFVQNRSNVLQSEQGNLNKYGLMVFSILLSLYLGYFVPIGVAVYWIAGNLFAILQLYILNWVINPKKYVDYQALQMSREKLSALQNMGPKKKWYEKDPNAKREKADYKRFFSISNKHLVFYSAKSGFYKYFEDVIEELLRISNVTIHYVTSDANDAIFKLAKEKTQIKPYYIGEKKLITLMMKMDADIVVMTMPDLDNFHIKRSYIRKDTEYIYMFHYPLSTHMVLRKGALDHYDTIFCIGEFQFDEIRQWEKLYGLPEKKLIACGYGQLEKLYRSYQSAEKQVNERIKVLVAPSWNTDNILDSCIDQLLDGLLGKGYDVTVRPHPEYVKRYGARMDAIITRYIDYAGGDLTFELDFSSNDSIIQADIIISDWSGIAYEYSLTTEKPSIFINTPPKINNREYDRIAAVPLELSLRDRVGIQVDPADLSDISEQITKLLVDNAQYRVQIAEIRNKCIANFGKSGQVGGQYIIGQLQKRGPKK
ncbi:MAG: YidC/Oxa1 family membrane protein insertase [Angelakisella sp.]|nr:YidC/Oxa1 family membrane protein insertase [Angelakisella sp.]